MPRKKAVSSKIYVLDTNILLHEPLAFLSFKENDVVVPMTVLEELDYIKDSKKIQNILSPLKWYYQTK